MARARLHIICGNCGCKDMFDFKIDSEGHDMSDETVKFEPAVFIRCNNCSTIHDLSTTIKEEDSGVSDIIGKFVTAKIKDQDGCRQGYVISVSPLIVQGQSGNKYECEGEPKIVINPPVGRNDIFELGPVLFNEEGEKLFKIRVTKRISMRQMSDLTGYKPSELSAFEFGRVKPPENLLELYHYAYN